MPIELNAIESRVIGCLLEKAVVTPDQYPLTLNALTNACNQKSSRNPVMNLSSGDVLHAVRSLQDKHLIRTEENFKTQVEKFTHRFCNTPFSDHQFDAAEYAIVCVLLLRGPRTPGELRANSGRLHTFADNEDVLACLDGLLVRDGGPVVTKLARTPGRKDSEYMHLFSGAVENTEAPEPVTSTPITSTPINHGSVEDLQPAPEFTESAPATSAPISSGTPATELSADDQASVIAALTQRVSVLEQQVARLQRQISSTMPDGEN